jgi:hypothetical protein
MITTNLRIVALVGSIGLLLFIIELVRRRRLKEEYTVLWVLTAIVFILLAAWTNLLRELTHAIGAISESSTLYFFGILFVILLLLHFSVRVSALERKLVSLIQELGLLTAQRKELERQVAKSVRLHEDAEGLQEIVRGMRVAGNGHDARKKPPQKEQEAQQEQEEQEREDS